MNSILIMYDSETLGQNYAGLIEAIQSLGPWWHCFESATIVKTEFGSEQVRDILNPYRNSGRLLVAPIAGRAAWEGFSGDCSAWLSDNL